MTKAEFEAAFRKLILSYDTGADNVDCVACDDSEGQVRLVGGPDARSGRVEVLHDGRWGTVCDDGWDLLDAGVVCRQLGFEDAVEAPREARFGEGAGPIWMDDVVCTGAEVRLAGCRRVAWERHNCRHSEDASAVCR